MSIWTQLESASRRDVDLLNRAMSILSVVASDPRTEVYLKERITQLEYEVNCQYTPDDRFKTTAVAFDLNKLHDEDDR